MESKQKIIAIAAVLVVIVAAVAVLMMNSGEEDNSQNDVKFLVQDSTGVYFWIQGEGETVMDAFVDAVEDFDIPFVPTESEGKITGIQSLFGIESKEISTNVWNWWAQYYFDGSKWEVNTLFMNNMMSADYDAIAMVYGDGTVAPKVTPSDAKIWNGSEKGVVFTIQSNTGMYFKVNGEGKTVLDAYKDAMKDFGINYETSIYNGAETGIQQMFGLEMTNAEPYSWWSQYTLMNGVWSYNQITMDQCPSEGCEGVLLSYTFEGKSPELAPAI